MKKNKKIFYEVTALLLILCFAFFLRIYSLGTAPLWVDESISVNIAKNILETGKSSLVTGADAGAYFLHYGMAFFMLFGQTEFFARLISVLFGLITIILAFFIGREYSKSGGIISALFFSIFYLEVFFSRQSRYYQLFQLVFFSALYLLYKSKEKPWLIYPALACLFIAIDTHLEGLILSLVFVVYILLFNRKKWFLALIASIPLLNKFFSAVSLASSSTATSVNYASRYLSYAHNLYYLLVLFVPGLIWGFIKKKQLTLMIILPSVLTLLGVFSLETFAFRYSYFFFFPILLYSAVLMSLLYDKYGKLILVPILILLLVPSNLFFPQTYVNMITPVDYQLYDTSAPINNYKDIPLELKGLNETILISYFSPDVEFYLRKPDFVVPFSLDGRGSDQISYNNSKGETVDMYSGSPILEEVPTKSYYLTADVFSISKLKPSQIEFYKQLTNDCSIEYENPSVTIWFCKK